MQYVISNTRPDGTLTVRFRYWLDGKLKTVPAKSVPRFSSEAQIITYLPILEAKYDHQKMEKEKREAWHDKYYDFVGLKSKYLEYAKEKAPRTWPAKIGYLDNYVFHFFLNEKRESNLNSWYLHFMEFRQWLKNVETFKNKAKRLAPNTINHCILELNMFMGFMAKLGMCNIQPRCEVYAYAKENSKKGLDSVFTETEAEAVFEFLTKKNPVLADAFWLLLKTGMRISEFRGIGPGNVRMGEIPQKNLNALIKNSDLDAYPCYLVFNSQVNDRVTIREGGSLQFIPLKTKKKISPEHTRFVPIFDIKAFQIIKKYMNLSKVEFDGKIYGDSLAQYPFFYDKVTSTILNFAFEDFYIQHPKYFPKTCHDCRHTYATWLGGHDITGTLQEYICGHQKESAKRYNHLKEQLLEKTKLRTEDVFSGW